MVIFIGNKNFTEGYVGNKKITEIWKGNEKVRPVGRQPGANTVAYYNFDDNNYQDKSGNSYITSMNSTGTITYTTVSGTKKALYVNGSTGIVSSNILSSIGTTITINIRCSCSTSSSGHDKVILSCAYDTSGNGFFVGSNNYYYNMRAWYQFNYNSQPSISIGVGAWHLLSYTISGGTMKHYLDGVLQSTITTSSTLSTDNYLAIGGQYRVNSRESWRTNRFWLGYIGDIIIENKARTQEEITAYYNQTKNEYLGSDIVITAVITQANQTVKINKYFANAHSINRGDGGATTNHTADTTHTYTSPGTYEITLSLGDGVDRWGFTGGSKPLVPQSGTTASNVYISQMPSLADWFGESATSVGNYFFYLFNYNGALTSLPAGSFDTSNITSVGVYFFRYFNYNGALTSLPANSFNTSNITTAGDYFFYYFNYNGALTSLPAGSFNTSNITTVGDEFFAYFNYDGKITKSTSGVSIKNPYSSSITFYYWNGSSSVSEYIPAGGTFTAYKSS